MYLKYLIFFFLYSQIFLWTTDIPQILRMSYWFAPQAKTDRNETWDKDVGMGQEGPIRPACPLPSLALVALPPQILTSCAYLYCAVRPGDPMAAPPPQVSNFNQLCIFESSSSGLATMKRKGGSCASTYGHEQKRRRGTEYRPQDINRTTVPSTCRCYHDLFDHFFIGLAIWSK